MTALALLALLLLPAATAGAAPGKCGAWHVVSNPTSKVSDLNGLAAIASNDIWAVGDISIDHGTLTEHWNGSQWSVVKSPSIGTSVFLSSASAVTSNDIWAVGAYQAQNQIWRTLTEHWNGKQWTIVKSPFPGGDSQLNDIKQVPGSANIWSVGARPDLYGKQLIEFYC